MASVLVVLTHIARALDPDLFSSTSHEHQPPRLLQLPFIRVFVQGRIGVSIFSLVTGYVCALKPIRQIARGQHEAAALGIAKSAFRRVPRLVLPVTIATVGIYVLCQLGAFRVAKVTDSPWLSYSSPEYKEHFVESVRYLLFNIIETWVYCRNAFDPNHWNLQPLLKGSMLVYISLLASMYARPKYRMMMSLGQWVYYWIANDCKFSPPPLPCPDCFRCTLLMRDNSPFRHAILLRPLPS
jgi:peptidoglycan/LPS O-acetylase OafA/YrhL